MGVGRRVSGGREEEYRQTYTQPYIVTYCASVGAPDNKNVHNVVDEVRRNVKNKRIKKSCCENDQTRDRITMRPILVPPMKSCCLVLDRLLLLYPAVP